MIRRTKTVFASGLPSSYKKRGRSKQRWTTDVFQGNAFVTNDLFEQLIKLNDLIKQEGGEFYITDLYRSWDHQAEARHAFVTKKKKAFVAKPGHSFHNAGRAVDFSVKELNFQSLDKTEWLQKFWDLAKPLGFRPVISIPDVDAQEAWHIDYPGEWSESLEKISYSEVAKAATLDIGGWDPEEDPEKVKRMFVQAQLIRLGKYEVGKIDGRIGAKTAAVLKNLCLGHAPIDDLVEILSQM